MSVLRECCRINRRATIITRDAEVSTDTVTALSWRSVSKRGTWRPRALLRPRHFPTYLDSDFAAALIRCDFWSALPFAIPRQPSSTVPRYPPPTHPQSPLWSSSISQPPLTTRLTLLSMQILYYCHVMRSWMPNSLSLWMTSRARYRP